MQPISEVTSRKRVLFLVIQPVILSVAYVAACLLRFDFSIPESYHRILFVGLCLALPLKVAVFYLARLHRGWWRFAGFAELVRLVNANLAASFIFLVICRISLGREFPRSIYVLDFLLSLVTTCGGVFAVRIMMELKTPRATDHKKNVFIYGAGYSGVTLIREIQSNPSLSYHVVGFIDDDPAKSGALLRGVRVLGNGRNLPVLIDHLGKRNCVIQEAIIAMPSATGRQMREALSNCRAAGLACKTVPGMGEILEGRVLTKQIRELSVNDLLGRTPVDLDQKKIRETIMGCSVLVTGAGGSIGSELCRQLGAFGPSRLVAFDQAESDLFRIDNELRKTFPNLDLVAAVGDICEAARVDEVIRQHAITSIFHAAAYKHVPMMECHILEAARNNVLGTWNVVQSARRHQVADFVMVSSDKAVNPANVMGLTKRLAELIVTCNDLPERNTTNFVCVRFGNVLGSNGSVVPLFQQQIAAGGPLTVTHPDIRRYFMTIPEAVQLVLQASTMGKKSEIFLLEMGEPVRIVDLAINMIRLAGLTPHEDIEIRYTGLRPGEKLFEELITVGDNIVPTCHEKIKVLKGKQLSQQEVVEWIAELESKLSLRDSALVLNHLASLVHEYQPSSAAGSARTEVASEHLSASAALV
jgi:FlaA1/EpsC-like NDP-sugar epimerase